MVKRTYFDCKGSRDSVGRPSRRKKIERDPPHRWISESDDPNTSTSAKKLKRSDTDVEVDASFGYRILNYLAVFSAISEIVKCKSCNGKVKFTEVNIAGLGFQLLISCDKCEPTKVAACPKTGDSQQAYDLNRRIFFAFRLLGIGLSGVEKFCAIMDLPKPICKHSYDGILKNINQATKAVCKLSMKNAAKEEKKLNEEHGNLAGLTVSGDGTWQKRGFSSLYGVASLIGHYTSQVLDFVAKSSYCKACQYWEKLQGTDEYAEWLTTHENDCQANHKGSAGKMEVDGMKEMFARSEELHGVKYTSYIGDGDSKTFKSVADSQPYENTVITKKECVGHVQKRMGTRLRNVKKQNKGLGGRGGLTGKLIDELTVYYGLAIRRCSHSVEKMRVAIWSTLFHKISTDENPQHHYCPPGAESWCLWQRASADNSLNQYKHKEPLSRVVVNAITPIYEDLCRDDLLERCLGGFTQNNNESLNSNIWSFAPKTNNNGFVIVEIATNLAISIFNDGFKSVLLIMQVMGLTIGQNAHTKCHEIDARRIEMSERSAGRTSKEARQLRRAVQKEAEDIAAAAEGLLYGAGIAD